MNREKLNWLKLANKFAMDGDPKGMRACAKELWQLDPSGMDGAAVMAEAALYTGDLDEARDLVEEILKAQPRHLRGRLVQGGIWSQEFVLDKAIPCLKGLVAECSQRQAALSPEDDYHGALGYILVKARGWLTDALYLAADPEGAGKELLALAKSADTSEEQADYYSKYLFMRNYREQGVRDSYLAAKKYAEIQGTVPYRHAEVACLPEKKLRIGYLSPDFREHAVSYFLAPLLRNFDSGKFSVYCYSTGRVDNVTKRLRSGPLNWRDLRGRSPRTAARLIAEDGIDILVELSGHTQNSTLPIAAYRPAPVQIAGIGYTNTTGVPAIDYFLSDETCLPSGDEVAASGFTERIIRLPHSHLCYAPGFVRELPEAGSEAPVHRNGYVTFGSFNNFAKATDEMLLLWRGILDQVRDSKLVIKSKICSIPSGQQLLRERLKRLNFELARVELRPYSPDYMEQYRDIDIALDTAPYNGGATTCEALFMGVPVITLRGRSHASRFGASILVNAGVEELVVENDLNYVRRAVQLGNSPKLIGAYHSGLRANVLKSPLMDAEGYMKELEAAYRTVWRKFCESDG